MAGRHRCCGSSGLQRGELSFPRKVSTMTSEFTEILTIDDQAEYLKLSKSSLYKITQTDRIPGNQEEA